MASKPLSYINRTAMEATKKAHIDGGIPVMVLLLGEITEASVGALIYFFEFACGISAYMSGVNPFNQPGVEAYKRNLFAMLGKPGYPLPSEWVAGTGKNHLGRSFQPG